MRFDLHVHSCYSKDSNADIDSILAYAEKKGLDGIAVCDHDTIEGGIACARRAEELGLELLVIPGIEVMSSKGHILVIGIKQNIEPHKSPEETIKRARQLGGVVIIPHPFKVTSHGIGFVEGLDIDAVEVLNSRCLSDNTNKKAKKAAESLSLAQVGGSDSHIPQMVGQAYTEIEASEKSVDSVLSAIREGMVSARGKKTPIHIVIIQMISGLCRKMICFVKRSRVA
ncbi:MAG: PHP domain-containing protein [Methanosarcinaceae archaeon]|nr:PHP domain-containing protein [Methanosarcinaceae archaeon]